MTSTIENSSVSATFADLDLPDSLLKAVTDLGFTQPTDIQLAAIPPLLAGRDITGIAQTGTGKTAAFGLPLLSLIDPSLPQLQAVVLTPTRELAMQVADAISELASHLGGVNVVAVYGGAPYGQQIYALRNGAQVLVGTPGRVMDHLDKGTANFSSVKMLVLDEADEMLRMGFAEDVDTIFRQAPEQRQVALFSATMPPAIRKVAQEHLVDPVEIAVSRQSSTVTSVEQRFAVVPFRHKVGALSRILATTDAEAAIVFCRTRAAAEEVGVELVARGVSAATISGDVAQREREKIVDRLRNGQLDVLVATDVAARGLDVERIGLVVNFDVPREAEAYVHRIGRTGRAGRTGIAMTFVTPQERNKLRHIERTIRTQLVETAVPSPADVSAHRTKKLLEQVSERIPAGRLDMYRRLVREHAETTGADINDVVAAVLALGVGDDGPSARRVAEQAAHDEITAAQQPPKRGARDDVDRSTRRDFKRDQRRGSRDDSSWGDSGRREMRGHGRQVRDDSPGARHPKPHRTPADATRYRVSVGFDTGAEPRGIVGAITNEGGLRGADIGKIAMFGSFALVDISTPLNPGQIKRIGRAKVGGRPLQLQVDEGPRKRYDDNRKNRHDDARGGRREDKPRHRHSKDNHR
ncbi:ATP-dependent RNA helicase DeaD [Micrococcales bacterium KH10]|nr:ATP-dependent RNA helicase DeaD [Micrococcales bacterium KH10]